MGGQTGPGFWSGSSVEHHLLAGIEISRLADDFGLDVALLPTIGSEVFDNPMIPRVEPSGVDNALGHRDYGALEA